MNSLLTGCDLETFDNGDLEGYWKLHAVDTLETAGKSDLTYQSLFWAVQGNLLSVCDNQDPALDVFLFRFTHVGDSLKLSDAKGYDKMDGDFILTNDEQLHRFGINNLSEGYHIEQLNSSHMRLTSKTLRLYFRKM